MLERSSLFTELARLCGEVDFSAVIHTARRSKDFFQANNIHLLDRLEAYRKPLGVDYKGRL